jgi:D-glucuronyl C5-epimerase C-terminus
MMSKEIVGKGINLSVDEKREEGCLVAYPLELSYLLQDEGSRLDSDGVPYHTDGISYHPNTVACYGLACWNQYLIASDDRWCCAFLYQARWLVEHEVLIAKDWSGWPIPVPHPDMPTPGSWLSALAQGNAISVLVRAYELTGEEPFLVVARRAASTFARDIFDGGVCAPVGENGIFFEEVAIYPAAHHLNGFIQSLFGLYDYLALTGDEQVGQLIERSLETLHCLFHEFDTGHWTRPNLLSMKLSSPAELAFQTTLLELLSHYSGCEHCALLARRWQGYQRHPLSRWCYQLAYSWYRCADVLRYHVRKLLFPRNSTTSSSYLRVCIPIQAFPVAGGMRTVVTNIAQVTGDIWKIDYMTQHVGPDREQFNIHRFGTGRMAPWQFPAVWLYGLAGFIKLIGLLRSEKNYQIILPQDGIYTSAFASLVAKIAGIRCVCIDHGNLTLLDSRAFRTERIKALKTENWPWLRRLLARLQYTFYWPSLFLLAWIGARFVDQYFVPGVSGDGVEDVCRRLGVGVSRVTRFANMIDIERYKFLDKTVKGTLRQKHGIAADAVVIAIVCRLTPEKG